MARKNIQMSAIAPFGIRIPPDLKDKLEVAARTNNRSMNSEINHLIEEGLARRNDARSKLPPGLFKPRPEGTEFDGPFNPEHDEIDVGSKTVIDKELLQGLAADLLKLASCLPDLGSVLQPAEFYRFAVDELKEIESTDNAEACRVFEELMKRAAHRFGWADFATKKIDRPEVLP